MIDFMQHGFGCDTNRAWRLQFKNPSSASCGNSVASKRIDSCYSVHATARISNSIFYPTESFTERQRAIANYSFVVLLYCIVYAVHTVE